MEEYKAKFIDFLLKTGALKVEGDFSLKSKRLSPWFVNIGDFNDGETSGALGEFYADSILNSGVDFDLLYGIPDKGREIAAVTAVEMNRKGKNVPRFSTRKEAKTYGESSNLSQAEKMKAWIIGRAPKNGQSIVQMDDVFTAGDAKYQAIEILKSLGEYKLPLLSIAVDRMEVGIDGKGAIEEYEQKTGTKVVSILNASDIISYLDEFLQKSKCIFKMSGEVFMNETQLRESIKRMGNYLRVYGTEKIRKYIEQNRGKLEQKIIDADRSVIPACDVETIEEFEKLVGETAEVKGIGGYKVGFELGLGYSLKKVVETAKKYTNKPVIYDHQKAGTDIPDTGKNFANVCKKAGVDAVILFPQAGPETERAWIYHCLDKGLNVIVGGRMTHPAYAVSEGGFITDEGALEMYRIAARAGITNFVVPGNKPEVIKQVKDIIEAEGISPIFYAPGFIAQGGSISDAAKVAGDRFHGIVGRGIYKAANMKEAAIEHTSKL